MKKYIEIGCSDYNCIVRDHRGGMATQGSCRCRRELYASNREHYPRSALIEAEETIMAMRDEITRLNVALDRIGWHSRECLQKYDGAAECNCGWVEKMLFKGRDR